MDKYVVYNRTKLEQELTGDEGKRRSKYKDNRGFWTAGIGHNLDASPLPQYTFPLSDASITAIFTRDIGTSEAKLDKGIPWWRTRPDGVQRVLLNMTFNMGWGNGRNTGLSAFHQFLALVRDGHYGLAAEDMKGTLWAKQVGPRAVRLENLMRQG